MLTTASRYRGAVEHAVDSNQSATRSDTVTYIAVLGQANLLPKEFDSRPSHENRPYFASILELSKRGGGHFVAVPSQEAAGLARVRHSASTSTAFASAPGMTWLENSHCRRRVRAFLDSALRAVDA